jgi:hypothetical protein
VKSARHCHQVLDKLLTSMVSKSGREAYGFSSPSTGHRSRPWICGTRTQKTARRESVDNVQSRQQPALEDSDYSPKDARDSFSRQQQSSQSEHQLIPRLDNMLGSDETPSFRTINDLAWPNILGQVGWETLIHGGSGG